MQVAQDMTSVKLVRAHVKVLPVLTKQAETLVSGTLIVTLLAVAADTHRLIVPIRVATLLALGDDMVTVHERDDATPGPTAALDVEQVNMMPATLVNPSEQSVAFTTTANALAAMHRKRLEVGDVESLATNHDATILAGP